MDGFELGQDKISPVQSSRVQRESEGVCKKGSTYPGIIRPIIERFRVAGDAMRSIGGFKMVIGDGHVDDFSRDFGIVLSYLLDLFTFHTYSGRPLSRMDERKVEQR